MGGLTVPIYNGTGLTDVAEVWDGTKKVVEAWVGSARVWIHDVLKSMNPEVYLTFNTSLTENQGSAALTGPTPTGSGGTLEVGTARYLRDTADQFSGYTAPWTAGGTLMCWARTVSVRDTATLDIIQRNSPTGTFNELYIIELSATNQWAVGATTGGVFWDVTTPIIPGEKDRQWHHLVATITAVSSTSAVLRLYVDGVLQATSVTRTVPVIDFSSATELYLARSRMNNTWAGNLDNVATFPRPLTAAEVTTIYDAQKPSMPFIPTILTLVLPELVVGRAVSVQLTSNFGATSWTATGLPAGLTLTSGGLLSGTPTGVSTGVLTVTASASGQTAELPYDWSVLSATITTNVFIPFDSNADIDNYLPIRGFDSRTSASSAKNPAFTFNGMLVAGDNSVATYWDALLATEVTDTGAEWILGVGDVRNTLTYPTAIILASRADLTNQVLLNIGSNGVALVTRTTGGTTSRASNSTAVAAGSQVRVTRSGDSYSVYTGGVLRFTHNLGSTLNYGRNPGNGYTGVSLYSTSGRWSTRVGSLAITGTTPRP